MGCMQGRLEGDSGEGQEKRLWGRLLQGWIFPVEGWFSCPSRRCVRSQPLGQPGFHPPSGIPVKDFEQKDGGGNDSKQLGRWAGRLWRREVPRVTKTLTTTKQ